MTTTHEKEIDERQPSKKASNNKGHAKNDEAKGRKKQKEDACRKPHQSIEGRIDNNGRRRSRRGYRSRPSPRSFPRNNTYLASFKGGKQTNKQEQINGLARNNTKNAAPPAANASSLERRRRLSGDDVAAAGGTATATIDVVFVVAVFATTSQLCRLLLGVSPQRQRQQLAPLSSAPCP